MYYERIFNKLYCIYNASENKTDNIWDKIIRELSNIVIDEQDRLISFDNLLKKSDIEMIEEIDKRITFLIELRGRFIIYLLKNTTLQLYRLPIFCENACFKAFITDVDFI